MKAQGASIKTQWMRGAALVTMVLVTGWAAVSRAGYAAQREAEIAEKSGESQEGKGEGPAPFNFVEFGKETPPFVAMLVNFGILAAGYYLLGKKSIANGLVARRAAIAKEIEEAERMRHEAEERARVYQAKLERVEEEARAAREGLIRAGEAERDRIIAEAEAKAERMRKDAEFLIAQELKQIRHDLLRDTVDAAVLAAEEILKKRVTQADHERLADDYLRDIGARVPSVPPPAARKPS
jgi:F-type H+-transporting ATPase subunit b